MANEVLKQLDTSKVAGDFNDFLSAQGLGDMNPSSAARYRQGVEVSPMDELLALNGFDLEQLFQRPLPEPPPLATIEKIGAETNTDRTSSGASSVRDAVKSLGLSDEEITSLSVLAKSGSSKATAELPLPLIQLLQNPGVNNAEDLLLQLGRFHALIGENALPGGQDLLESLQQWMKELGTDNSRNLLQYLEKNPTTVKELLRDPITGIIKPLGHTSRLLQITNAFTEQSIAGSTYDETLLGSRSGGTRLIGGGGKDLYVVTISTNPFPLRTGIADFDPVTGSKIVLDITNLRPISSFTFKVANTNKAVKSLSRSATSLIMSKKLGTLYLNDNGAKIGYGKFTGGAIAHLENSVTIKAEDLLIFNNHGLLNLNGTPF